MKIPEWVRHIPHPCYGNYGGRKRRCESAKAKVCPLPIDGMDVFFQIHDRELQLARATLGAGGAKKAEEMRQAADSKLATSLRGYKGPYARKLYGPIYRQLALIPFRA